MNPKNETLISLNNVGVCYKRLLRRGGEYWAIKDVSFDVLKGETVGIIGGNGAGKSTLMRLLAGIINPDIGTMKTYGASTQLLSLQVGFDRDLSGRENVILSGMLLGKTRKQMLVLMPEIIEFSGLKRFIDESIKTYSTGMKARLGFAVSCHTNPDILLIDEVLGVGDQAFKEKSSALLKARIESNQTVVLVSHAHSTLQELCDRLIWIEDGITREQGDTDEVYSKYAEFMESQD